MMDRNNADLQLFQAFQFFRFLVKHIRIGYGKHGVLNVDGIQTNDPFVEKSVPGERRFARFSGKKIAVARIYKESLKCDPAVQQMQFCIRGGDFEPDQIRCHGQIQQIKSVGTDHQPEQSGSEQQHDH